MTAARVLVIDGNRATTRERQIAVGGEPSGEGYVRALQGLVPVSCDIIRPADGEVRFPPGVGIADYDGVAITGSALNIYDGGAHIERQIELAREVFAVGVPFFGSCWGLQVAVVVAGGSVRPNPLGREFGFARRIQLSAAGRAHRMFREKPGVFEAITVHRDDVAELPAGARVLAHNDLGVQALEVFHGKGACWGVQYHPEYTFGEIAATARRYEAVLIEEQLFADHAELEAFVADLRALMRDSRDRRLTWKYGIGEGLTDAGCRCAELRNWLELEVLPHARQRH